MHNIYQNIKIKIKVNEFLLLVNTNKKDDYLSKLFFKL